MFYVEFGWPVLLLAVLLLLAVPALVATVGWYQRELRTLHRQHQERTDASPSSPSRSAYLNFVQAIAHQTSKAVPKKWIPHSSLVYRGTAKLFRSKQGFVISEKPNSLQAILGLVTNLRTLSGEELAHTCQEYLVPIEHETQRLIDLTAKLRLLAQLEAGQAPISLQPVQLRSAVADVIMERAEQADDQGIELVYQGPSRPSRVLADRDQITQALGNLVDNSLKYTRADSRAVVISVTPTETMLQLAVSDDGTVIPEAGMPYIPEDSHPTETIQAQPVHFFDILYVRSDTPVHRLAGSIAHALRADGCVAVQAIGPSAVNQMVKGLAVARNYLGNEDTGLVAVPEMVEVEIEGDVRSAVRMVVRLVDDESGSARGS